MSIRIIRRNTILDGVDRGVSLGSQQRSYVDGSSIGGPKYMLKVPYFSLSTMKARCVTKVFEAKCVYGVGNIDALSGYQSTGEGFLDDLDEWIDHNVQRLSFDPVSGTDPPLSRFTGNIIGSYWTYTGGQAGQLEPENEIFWCITRMKPVAYYNGARFTGSSTTVGDLEPFVYPNQLPTGTLFQAQLAIAAETEYTFTLPPSSPGPTGLPGDPTLWHGYGRVNFDGVEIA